MTLKKRTKKMDAKLFIGAFPYADNVQALPVKDLDQAAEYYARTLGLTEVERTDDPPTLIMQRDGIRFGFAINGGDSSQEGAAILVSDIERARNEVAASGAEPNNWRVDERDGKRYQVFFLVAPDGLCYYFHQELTE